MVGDGTPIPQFMCLWKTEQGEPQETLILPGDPPLPHLEQCGWTPSGIPFLCEC